MEDWEDITENPTWRGLQAMARLVNTYIKGENVDDVGRLFCSGPGLGKTEIVERAIKEHNAQIKRVVPTTPAGFVGALWLHRDKPMFIDDAHRLPRDEVIMNLAKNAWGATRLVVTPSTDKIQKNQDVKNDPGNRGKTPGTDALIVSRSALPSRAHV